MFAARGIAVSFSVFVMVYCVLSLAVCLAWRRCWLLQPEPSGAPRADLLFALRMFPLVSAAVITAAFTVPSFLSAGAADHRRAYGRNSLVLGICGALLGIFGVVNAVMALRRTSRTISAWTTRSATGASRSPVPVLRISRTCPGDDGRWNCSSPGAAVGRSGISADHQ